MILRKDIIKSKYYVNAVLSELRALYYINPNSKEEKDLKVILKFINYINFKCNSFKLPFFRIIYDYRYSYPNKIQAIELIFSLNNFGWNIGNNVHEMTTLIYLNRYIFSNIDIKYRKAYYVLLEFDKTIEAFPNNLRENIKEREYQIFSKSFSLICKILGYYV